MTPEIKIDTSKFDAALKELSRLTGVTRRDVLRAEATAILDRCIAGTVVANEAKIESKAGSSRAYVRKFNTANRVMNGNGQIFFKTASGRWLYIGKLDMSTGEVTTTGLMARPVSPNLQAAARQHGAAFMTNRLEYVKKAKDAAGLAVQSWVQTADALGLPIKPTRKTSKARKSVATTGIHYVNGTGNERRSWGKDGIEILNFLPYNSFPLGTSISMQYLLKNAVNGRAAYFRRNLRNGVFEDMDKVAKRYPGLRAYL